MALIPRRIEKIDLTEFGYADCAFEAWISAPLTKVNVITKQGQDETVIREGMLELFTSWNFEDEEGEIPHTVEGFERVPLELTGLMIMAYLKKISGGVTPDFRKASPSTTATGKRTGR